MRQEKFLFSENYANIFLFLELDSTSSFLPKGVTEIAATELKRLNTRKIGNASYSFMLSYKYQDQLQQKYLILKIYRKTLDPVFRKHVNNENIDRCFKEFQVLKSLEKVYFPVPKALACETDTNVIGNPFLIMQKEEISPKNIFNIKMFAKELAVLHSLDIDKLGITAIKLPKNSYDFARDCLIYVRLYLNIYPKHNKELMKDFEFAINWLKSNLRDNRCSKYRLLHGDYRARLNAILTKDGRMLVTDWEDAQIGDPMYDVGIAYVRNEVDFGKKTADRFVQEYLSYFDEDVSEKIRFYKLIAYLRLAVTHSSVLSAPLRAYEIRGTKALLLFPFIHLPFIKTVAGTDSDIIWVKNFRKFVKEIF